MSGAAPWDARAALGWLKRNAHQSDAGGDGPLHIPSDTALGVR